MERKAASLPTGEHLLTAKETAAKLGISKRTLYLHVSKGTIPPPAIVLSSRLVRWRAVDIDAFIRSKATRPMPAA